MGKVVMRLIVPLATWVVISGLGVLLAWAYLPANAATIAYLSTGTIITLTSIYGAWFSYKLFRQLE